MPLLSREPFIAGRIAARQPFLFERGPIRQDLVDTMLHHGQHIRHPDTIAQTIGYFILPFIQKLLSTRMNRRFGGQTG